MSHFGAIEGQAYALTIMLEIHKKGTVYGEQLKRDGFTVETYYRALKVLMDAGLVTKELTDEGGRGVRKLYRLTTEGEAVAKLLEEVDRLIEHAARRKEKEEAKKPKAPG